MTQFRFSWEASPQVTEFDLRQSESSSIGKELLWQNCWWFVRMRWVFIAALLLFQVLFSFDGNLFHSIGLQLSGFWPLWLALVLSIMNVLFFVSLRQSKNSQIITPALELWTQIITDLVCLSFAAHFIGSIGTIAPFLFALHISLSCIFFSNRSSFLVALIAMTFYTVLVGMEYGGLIEPRNIFTNHQVLMSGSPAYIALQTLSMDALFFLIWFVVARLSVSIRIHEYQLLKAQELTRDLVEERERFARHMIHQLKSPVDAISSNIALANAGYCGDFSEKTGEVFTKIDQHCAKMRKLVLDVLKLSKSRSPEAFLELRTRENIGDILTQTLQPLHAAAEKRRIRIFSAIEPAFALVNVDQIEMMFNNLIFNAINYSFDGGEVKIVCAKDPFSKAPVISIVDSGIGISEDKLPRIFDEYFRTAEAVRHNSQSTGIGLAIVKNVAILHNLDITVNSESGKGTTFQIRFPVKPD